jgi:hypothetical protein
MHYFLIFYNLIIVKYGKNKITTKNDNLQLLNINNFSYTTTSPHCHLFCHYFSNKMATTGQRVQASQQVQDLVNRWVLSYPGFSESLKKKRDCRKLLHYLRHVHVLLQGLSTHRHFTPGTRDDRHLDTAGQEYVPVV